MERGVIHFIFMIDIRHLVSEEQLCHLKMAFYNSNKEWRLTTYIDFIKYTFIDVGLFC